MDISIRDLEQLAAEVEKLEILGKELEWLYYPVKSPNGDGIPSKGNSPSSPTERALAKIERTVDDILKQRAVITEHVTKINKWLEELEDKELATIIKLHYYDRLTWRETCKEVYGYSDRQVCRKRVMRYFGKEK